MINGSFVGAAKRVGAALNAERPLFVLQHTGGCADLASVMLDQQKAIEKLYNKQEAAALKAGKEKEKGRPRLEDLMSEHLPFDPFAARSPEWVVDKPAKHGMPRIQFTGIVGNKPAKTQPSLIEQMNAIFANWPPNANPEAILCIDPFVLRGAALQDLISRTMCSAGNANDELNGEFADQKRLHLAWEMHGALTYAAEKQVRIATMLQFAILLLSFMTATLSVLRSNVEWFFPFFAETLTTELALPAAVSNPTARMLRRMLSEGGDVSSGVVDTGTLAPDEGIDEGVDIAALTSTEDVDGSCTADPGSLVCQVSAR